jgi:NAD(P)-dependent dehydrogenase (short-subunit alcohol dehydrogenase family)
MATPLSGKIALVTGAGRGIGAAISRALVEAGAVVALVARTSSDLQTLAGELEAAGGRVAVLPGDVGDEATVERIFAAAEARLGPIDILINNAGIPTRRPFQVADYPIDDFDRIVGVNLRGAFLCARAAFRTMRERRSGTIVNIGSISGIRAAPDVLPYSVAKFGIEALSQTILAEATQYGIKTHLVAPGVTNSSIWDRKEVPLPADVRARMLEPSDVAEVVLFLLQLPQRVRIDRVVLTPNVFPMKLWDYPLLDS